jgi:hypothetical protein
VTQTRDLKRISRTRPASMDGDVRQIGALPVLTSSGLFGGAIVHDDAREGLMSVHVRPRFDAGRRNRVAGLSKPYR